MFFFISFNILHCVHRTTRGILLSLTLSYSSEGSPALAVFSHHQNCLSKLYLDFLTTTFLFFVVTLAFKKSLVQVLTGLILLLLGPGVLFLKFELPMPESFASTSIVFPIN
jgi:hypothetical protein